MNKLSGPVKRALEEMGISEMTEVQKQAVPAITRGEDVIAQSLTGTGKTAAFAIPIIESVSEEKMVQALVLVPTRELATQVGHDFRRIERHTKIRTATVYGGAGIEPQISHLKQGVQVVVGTPGRVLDLMERRALSLDAVKFFVLDEADVMLAMGFVLDVERILRFIPKKRQMLLFCVDFPDEIADLTKRHMNHPKRISLVEDDKSARGVTQSFYSVPSGKKLEVLLYLLKHIKPERAIIFCKTKRRVAEISRKLERNGFRNGELQGDLSQAQRDRTMDAFKKGQISMLVATDVAARGIHVEKISHIFNYELPHDINYYIHRIGRTGRMNAVGEAISLCYHDELNVIGQIERIMGRGIDEKPLPEKFKAPTTIFFSHKWHGKIR